MLCRNVPHNFIYMKVLQECSSIIWQECSIFNIISIQHYMYYALIMTKKILFFSVLCSIRCNMEKNFHHWLLPTMSTTFVIMIKICCYYIHYTMIMTKNMYFYFCTMFTTACLRKNIFYISAVGSLCLDHNWKYIYFHSYTLGSPTTQ